MTFLLHQIHVQRTEVRKWEMEKIKHDKGHDSGVHNIAGEHAFIPLNKLPERGF